MQSPETKCRRVHGTNVNDPYNKAAVLKEIDFLSERDAVTKSITA
jgi:hypothetical protein